MFNKSLHYILVVNYQTTKNKVNVKIVKSLEINSKLWWLSEIFFFIISVLGIFDTRADKRCQVTSCDFDVELTKQTNMTVSFNKFEEDGKAVEIESNVAVSENKNVYYIDKIAKKRIKVTRIVKLAFWIALIITAIILASIYL